MSLVSLTVEKGLTKQVLDGPPDLQGAALAAPLGSTSRWLLQIVPQQTAFARQAKMDRPHIAGQGQSYSKSPPANCEGITY